MPQIRLYVSNALAKGIIRLFVAGNCNLGRIELSCFSINGAVSKGKCHFIRMGYYLLIKAKVDQ
jgi:hypothetical protein